MSWICGPCIHTIRPITSTLRLRGSVWHQEKSWQGHFDYCIVTTLKGRYCRFSSNNASRSVTVDRHGRETMPCRHTHIQTMMRSNTNRWEVCVDESRRGKKRLEGSLILKPKRRNTQCGVAACPSPGAGAPKVLHRHKLWFISAQRLLHTPAFKWKPLFRHLTVLWLSLTYRSHHIKITKYVTFCTNLLFTCLRLLETQYNWPTLQWLLRQAHHNIKSPLNSKLKSQLL